MDYKELEKYIKQLFQKYLNKYTMSLQDKQDVIQESMIQIFNKEKEGVLSGDIESNKNYIFIVVRNFVLRKVYPHKNIIDYVESVQDLISSTPTIDNDMTNEVLSLELKNIVKSNKFTDNERYFINRMLDGYTKTEIRKELGISVNEMRNVANNVKSKITLKLNKKIKYLVEYPNITYGFKTAKALARHMKVDPITLNRILTVGKSNFGNFRLIVL